MFGLTSSFKAPFLLKEKVRKTANPISKMPDFSRFALELLARPNFEQSFSEWLSEPSLLHYFRSSVQSFRQLLIVNRQQKTIASSCEDWSDELNRVVFSQYSEHEHHFAFRDNSGQHYIIYGLPLWDRQQQLLGNIFVVCFKPVPDQKHLVAALSPFHSTVEKILEVRSTQLYHCEKAIENERKEFAADLHDTVAQILSYLNFKVSSLKSLCQTKQNYQHLQRNVQDIHQQVIYANRLTRELIDSSRVQLSSQPISKAIQLIVDEYEALSSIVFEIDNRCQQEIDSLPSANEIIYAVRESITNLVRHSHASHARILIRKSPNNTVLLQIEDNGIGIGNTSKRKDSFGLQIMRERVDKAGALLSVESRQGGGTQVSIYLPLE